MLEIHTRVSRIGSTSIVMDTEMYRAGPDELLTVTEVVYVDFDSRRGVAREVPDEVRALISHFEGTGQVLPVQDFPNLAAR